MAKNTISGVLDFFFMKNVNFFTNDFYENMNYQMPIKIEYLINKSTDRNKILNLSSGDRQ